MASSGSYNFSLSRDNIINTALQLAGIIGEGETGTTNQISEAATILNMIVKLREADGMPLWSLKRGYILPFSGGPSINTDSHEHCSWPVNVKNCYRDFSTPTLFNGFRVLR